MADAAGMYAYWTAAGPVGEQYRGFQPEETCSLALDLDGSPQIACVGSLLRLYRRAEAGWTSQTLAESTPFGERLWLPLVCGH
jgi:hypothetical protein